MFRAIDPDPAFEPISSVSKGASRFAAVIVPEEWTRRAAEMKKDYDNDLIMLIRRSVISSPRNSQTQGFAVMASRAKSSASLVCP
jgi:hypothetical protein